MKYVGKKLIPHEESPIKGLERFDIAMMFIRMYGGCDGAHHKDWVLDAVAKIYYGAPVETYLRIWDNGYIEYDYVIGEPPEAYHNWVSSIAETDGYNFGVAP